MSNKNIIKFKVPSLKRDDMISVLDALVEDRVYSGEKYEKSLECIKTIFNTENIVLINSKLTAGLLLSHALKAVYPQMQSVIASNNSDPSIVGMFIDKGFSLIPIDITPELLPDFTQHSFKENSFLFFSYNLGFPVNADILSDYDIPIIADFSGSFNACYNNKPIGQKYDAIMYSFKDDDIISSGDGACIVFSNKKLYNEVLKLCNAWNVQLSDFNASLFMSQYSKIKKIHASRQSIAQLYFGKSKNKESLLYKRYEGIVEANYNTFPIIVSNIMESKAIASQMNIEIRQAIGKPLSIMYKSFTLNDSVSFPNTELYASSLLLLPIYPSLQEENVERICNLMNKISA